MNLPAFSKMLKKHRTRSRLFLFFFISSSQCNTFIPTRKWGRVGEGEREKMKSRSRSRWQEIIWKGRKYREKSRSPAPVEEMNFCQRSKDKRIRSRWGTATSLDFLLMNHIVGTNFWGNSSELSYAKSFVAIVIVDKFWTWKNDKQKRTEPLSALSVCNLSQIIYTIQY